MVESAQLVICMGRQLDMVTILKATTIYHDACISVSGFKTLQTQFYLRFEQPPT